MGKGIEEKKRYYSLKVVYWLKQLKKPKETLKTMTITDFLCGFRKVTQLHYVIMQHTYKEQFRHLYIIRTTILNKYL